MKIIFHQKENKKIAEVQSPSAIINNAADALDLIANLDAKRIILHKENVSSDFFDLRTGLAGEIMQKLVNYQVQLAIVGNFESTKSKSLHAFIIECNRGQTLFFAGDLDSAKKFLS